MLEAASEVLASKSYVRATLEEIARKAEFGKGTLYNYFPGGKEEILFSILDELYDNVVGIAQQELADERILSDPRQAFEHFVRKVLEYYDSAQAQFVIVTKEAHRLLSESDPKGPYFLGQRQRLIASLERPIELAIHSGSIKRLPPHAVAHMLIGNINGCQLHTAMCCQKEGETGPSIEERVTLIMSLLFDGLLTNP